VDPAAARRRRLGEGKTIGIDATTLEANAALRSIVQRDTGASYLEFLTQLAQASGIETPTREELARVDRERLKKGSNDDWTHPLDPDAKITKMKDGRTHLAHKAEHAVDLETGAVVAVTVQGADEGDTATSIETLIEAAEQIETVAPDGEGLEEVVADKGYHSNHLLVDLEAVGVRSYISEPIAAGATGGATPTHGTPSTTADGFAVRAGNGSCGSVVNGLSAHSLTSTKRVGCGVATPRGLQGCVAALVAGCGHCLRIQQRSRRRSGRDLGLPRHRSTYTCVATAAESDSPS
jgi:hypothetical protein